MGTACVYLGLGSNQADPKRQVTHALLALLFLEKTWIRRVSSVYQTQPWGPVKEQPPFVNAVVGMETALAPEALLLALQAIERSQGRVRDGQRWGPRVLDIDILLYGDMVYNSEGLTLPHPFLTVRDFVVYPLLEIAPGLVLPDGQALAHVARDCTADNLIKL
jgi:2-amino-4-hydroxy-6-hydroxymethyldihydropteridine diphosphokinase